MNDALAAGSRSALPARSTSRRTCRPRRNWERGDSFVRAPASCVRQASFQQLIVGEDPFGLLGPETGDARLGFFLRYFSKISPTCGQRAVVEAGRWRAHGFLLEAELLQQAWYSRVDRRQIETGEMLHERGRLE